MAERTCSIEGCGRRVDSRGWCSTHYNRWQKHGDPQAEIPVSVKNRQCSVEICEQRAYSRGWCRGHYSRWLRTGSTNGGVELVPKDPSRACSVNECGRLVSAKGLCSSHYRKLRFAESRCAVDQCDRRVAARGWCRGHYNRWREHGDPEAGAPVKFRSPIGSPAPTFKEGYVLIWGPGHPNAQKNGYMYEHIKVMADQIGRPLRIGENVHHMNGIRHDNRIENLELWVTMQPSGQRVSDLIRHANEILEVYGSEPERFENLVSHGGESWPIAV